MSFLINTNKQNGERNKLRRDTSLAYLMEEMQSLNYGA